MSRFIPIVLSLITPILAAAAQDAKPPANLLSNGDFELGRQFWSLDKGGKTAAKLDINRDDAPAGGQSAIITIDSVEEWGVQFSQRVDGGKAGKTYTFAAMAKSAGDPVKIRLEIERAARPWDRAARSDQATLTKDKWTEIRVTFKVDKPFSEGWTAYVSCGQSKSAFRVTQLRLYEGEYVPFKEQRRDDLAAIAVALFDTGAPSDKPLAGDVIVKRTGWTALPEDTTAHAFKGDVVLMNNRLALVLRNKGSGAELYSISPEGIQQRSVLKPPTTDAVALAGLKILENNPSGGSIEAQFRQADGKVQPMGFELKMAQGYVKVNAAESMKAVRVEAPCRFAVMPDFFADDIVVDAAALPVSKADLPSENFLMQLLGDGQAILMSVWTDRDTDVVATLSGQGTDRHIDAADIPCDKKGKVWVGVLTAPGIWHTRDIAASDAGKIVPLDWKPPIPAMWRIDWRRDDQLADSWEIIVQRPTGDFTKYGMVGSPDTIPATRKRWATVYGTFLYPCWIASNGQAYIQPFKDKVHFAGPMIAYPLARSSATPLDAYTVVDIVRATLGVGPCEYILDLEGQQNLSKGRATCANRDTLNPIYEKKQQKQRKADVEKSLTEVLVFIRYIRFRIETYVNFGHEILAYMGEQKKAHPELAKPLEELETLAKAMDARFAARRDHIKTPDEAAAMIEAFRKDGLDDDGPNAYEKCRKFTNAIVDIGGNQDELVGECRLAVKILRQRPAWPWPPIRACRSRPRNPARSQKVLRNPAGHEGARH